MGGLGEGGGTVSAPFIVVSNWGCLLSLDVTATLSFSLNENRGSCLVTEVCVWGGVWGGRGGVHSSLCPRTCYSLTVNVEKNFSEKLTTIESNI